MRRSGSIPASALFAAAILWTAYAGTLHAQMGSDGGTSTRSQQQRPSGGGAGATSPPRQHRQHQRMQAQQRRQHQRAQAHARMKDTMYASTPSPADAAVFWHPVLPPPPRVSPSERSDAPAPPAQPASAATEPHRIPFFAAASDPRRQGLARIVNHADEAGTVRIDAFDDDGTQYGPLTLSIGARQSVDLDSSDLENGSPGKGLAGATGPGEGAWRLEMTTPLELEVLAYVRTRDGFLTSMHDLVPRTRAGHRVAFFNPGRNASQVSRLRLINPGAQAAEVTIEGIDDHGESPGAAVRLSLPARASRTLTARQLESGEGLEGALGAGKWRLVVHSEQPIRVMSLLSSPTGRLTNLSTAPDSAGLDGESATTTHDVPLFPPASDPRRQGLARVVNDSDEAGTVRIDAFDDDGEQYGPLTLDVGAGDSVHFNSRDLENGNPGKGLSGSTGPGTGDWRLTLSSRLDLRVLSYIRTHDGFLTGMHDLAPRTGSGDHHVAFFNPGDNARQVSRLRLINPGAEAAEVTIEGIDGNGESPGARVRLSLPARASRTLTARQLESGEGAGLSGALGDGAGKWRLVVRSERPIRVMSLLSSPTGHLTNLSTAPGGAVRGPEQTAEEVFRRHVSEPVVQSKCVHCHVAEGLSGHTRLVFVRSSNPDHLALNLQAFRDFFTEVEGAAEWILNKIQGVGHGGGVQVPAGTADFTNMERFLALLGGDVGGPTLTPETLFDTVRMEPLRDTLRRAALVLAGRTPTEAEYAAFAGDAADRRATLRGLMNGPEFHEFLIRGANDRLLTDRGGDQVIDFNLGYFVEYTNEAYRRKKAAHESGDEEAFWKWADKARHGFRRAPLELIAHVAENDLPYTEILTADYIMANPHAARAYGDGRTRFDDPEDFDEFRPSRILSYYRKGEDGFVQEHDLVIDARRVTDPGALRTDYPHAGILNTTAFLGRYPTTATNRNRARSRWTWYHFLGLDVEKSAPRTTDPEALADTNNPTMRNPACTVCHRILDPVAGLFQNYGEAGYYRDSWGGRDSLDDFYKNAAESEARVVSAETWRERETLRWTLPLQAGTTPLAVTYYKGGDEERGNVRLDRLRLRDGQGRVLTSIEFEDLEPTVVDWGRCGDRGWNEATRRHDHLTYWGAGRDCALWVDVETPAAGDYTAEVVVWERTDPGKEHVARVSVTTGSYRWGDTWYRDMRVPGFGGEEAPNPDDSVQWLAARIVADERFAEAAVRFWWPAVMGSEVAEPPEDAGDADFEGRLLAANAQAAEVERLARGFRSGFRQERPYNLKDLLAEVVLSRWFRAGALTDADPVRRVALRDAGARRLLTPEELARKTGALTGYLWGRSFREFNPHLNTESAGLFADPYGLLYGGIDSDGIKERARDLTTVMGGVARRHAAQVSCPVVMREFYLGTEADRRLFDGIGKDVTPVSESSAAFGIESGTWGEGETHALDATLAAGPANVRLAFTNDYNTDDHGDRNLHLDRLDLRTAAGRVVASYELERLDAVSDCNRPNRDAFSLHCSGSVNVPMEIPADGRYRVEVVAWAEQAGDALPELAITVESDAERSAGARAIRDKLVELHERLLGVRISPHSPDVEAAFRLFVDVWQRIRASGNNRFESWRCDYQDVFYFKGINDALVPSGGPGDYWWD